MEINWGLRFEEPLLPRCGQLGSNSRAITLHGRVREFEHSDPVPDDGGVQVLCLSVISSGVDFFSRYLQCTEKGSVHGGYCPVCHRILYSMICHTDQYGLCVLLSMVFRTEQYGDCVYCRKCGGGAQSVVFNCMGILGVEARTPPAW